ncbi:hypothetical protein H6P81_021209 [Aristolochia fimbriata]|uniref:Uncharacterized protein n=1 Tax=Aristolochia fimbriata TaxID=158543 RepID=A0AAV7DS15_ARIFI|nr:hypothetical protein H6P81_021209 [Aristolochia fimbriata]
MACPSACVSSAKAICPSLPLGDGLQLFSRAGKGPSGPRDPFAQLEFFDLSRSLRDRSVPPLPILTCLCGAYGAFAASPCTGRGIGRADQRRARASGARWTCASGASGREAQSGVSVYFPLRLSLSARVCAASARTPQCSWTHVNAAVRWTWLDSQSESDRPTFAFDRRCPWPGAGAFRIGVLASSVSQRMLPG